jgi:3-deoxy-7-phosphoheptulonate synthase
MSITWTPDSWLDRPVAQQPAWPDADALKGVLDQISTLPPLVFAGEARDLTEALGEVAQGRAFLLQAGDCAESFDGYSADGIRDRLKVILQMAVALTYSGGLPVVKVGRIAGQFAKPRSSDTETIDGVELPSFRGHIINDPEFGESARIPDPQRLLQAYQQSASTLNLLRAFTKGGFANLAQVHSWNQEFVAASPQGKRYQQLADGIEAALRFMSSCGINVDDDSRLEEVDFYTSHEALLLDYEQALTRQDSLTDDWYDCSAHMLWIGERTRQLDGAHVEFLRGVKNPLGCKVALNPEQIPGRLTLISRMGADTVTENLPHLLEAVKDADHPVVWACDPMHGNTFTSETGLKTRHFDDICREVEGFFSAHAQVGTWAGGIHIELTGEDVTECLGGSEDLGHSDLEARYETICDPRLNGKQSIDLAFRVAEFLQR